MSENKEEEPIICLGDFCILAPECPHFDACLQVAMYEEHGETD